MEIALVHDFLVQWGGAERVLKYFTQLYPEAPIYTIVKDQKMVDEFFPGKKIITSFLQDYPGMPDRRKYYFSLMPKAIESFDFSQYDLVLSDSSAFAKGIITNPPTKHVCYLHTPTRYLTVDLEEYIANAPIPLPVVGRPFVRSMVKKLQKWDLQASKRPDYLIANSEYISERCQRYYGRTPDAVVFPPVEINKFKIAEKISDYWLVLGRNEPYKRTDLAIEAANQLQLKLKVAGGGSDIERLKKIAGPTVEFVGRVSDEKLVDLYSRAIGLVFPPEEDAGITPLESMACGRPVVAYGKGGVLESIIPGETGEFFNEQSVESLVKVLKDFNTEKYDPSTIRARAEKFDVEVFQQKIKRAITNTINI